MVWGHITVGARLTVYTICWLPCLSKYVMVANSVLYVWAGLGWRSAGGDSLGLVAVTEGGTGRQTDRRQQPENTQPWGQGRGEAGQSTNVHVGEGQEAQSPTKERCASQTHLLLQEPWQREFHPAKKQATEAEGRTERANPGKAVGQHRAERTRPRRQMDKSGGRQKRKRATRALPTMAQLLPERGGCDRNTSAFWSSPSIQSGLVQAGLGTGPGQTHGAWCDPAPCSAWERWLWELGWTRSRAQPVPLPTRPLRTSQKTDSETPRGGFPCGTLSVLQSLL